MITWPHELVHRSKGEVVTPNNIRQHEFYEGSMLGLEKDVKEVTENNELHNKVRVMGGVSSDLNHYPFEVVLHSYYYMLREYENGALTYEMSWERWEAIRKEEMLKEMQRHQAKYQQHEPEPQQHHRQHDKPRSRDRGSYQRDRDQPKKPQSTTKTCSNWNKGTCEKTGDHHNDGIWWLHACGYCFWKRKVKVADHKEPVCEFKKTKWAKNGESSHTKKSWICLSKAGF